MTVGVVLAGGEGRRLGRRKADLRLPANVGRGQRPTLVEWALTRLAAVPGIGEIVVAAGGSGSNDALPPGGHATAEVLGTGVTLLGRPAKPAISICPDGPGAGPAAGLLGAAAARPGRRLLLLACDMPLVPVALLAEIAWSDAELAAAVTDPKDLRSMHPTCALWTRPALDGLAERVRQGDNRLYTLTRRADLRVRPVDAAAFGKPEEVLLNVNCPDDWKRAKVLLGRSGRVDAVRRKPNGTGSGRKAP